MFHTIDDYGGARFARGQPLEQDIKMSLMEGKENKKRFVEEHKKNLNPEDIELELGKLIKKFRKEKGKEPTLKQEEGLYKKATNKLLTKLYKQTKLVQPKKNIIPSVIMEDNDPTINVIRSELTKHHIYEKIEDAIFSILQRLNA